MLSRLLLKLGFRRQNASRNCQLSVMNLRNELRLTGILVLTVMVTVGAAAVKTPYAQLSNPELRRNALQLVRKIRELVYSYEKKDRDLMADYDRKQRPDLSRGSAQTLRKEWLQESDAAHDSTMRKYKELYWSDAVLVADEMLRRLPKQKQQANISNVYQHPTNVLGVQTIADNLELLAKSLSN